MGSVPDAAHDVLEIKESRTTLGSHVQKWTLATRGSSYLAVVWSEYVQKSCVLAFGNTATTLYITSNRSASGVCYTDRGGC